jgi:hypothetical protein
MYWAPRKSNAIRAIRPVVPARRCRIIEPGRSALGNLRKEPSAVEPALSAVEGRGTGSQARRQFQ